MNYDMSSVDQGITYFPSAALYASLEVGSNGDPYGYATSSEGDDQGEEAWGFNVWDADGSSNFDSGLVAVQSTGASDGNESLIVGSAAPMSYSGDSFGTIASVQLQAAVEIPAEAAWSDVSLNFYSDGSLVETDNLGVGPAVNTINTPNSPQAEQVLTFFPSHQSDKVVVTANFRMSAPGTSNPGPIDMFGNIFINGS